MISEPPGEPFLGALSEAGGLTELANVAELGEAVQEAAQAERAEEEGAQQAERAGAAGAGGPAADVLNTGAPAPPPPPGAPGGKAHEPSPGGAIALSAASEHKPQARPSARFLTIVVVLTTFVAAVGGFFLNRASAASSNDSDLAQELSLQASGAETSAYQQAETDYAQYLALQALKAQAADEMLESTYDQPGALEWVARYQATSQQVTQTAPEVPADLDPYLANGNPDPNFPYDFFAGRASGATYLGAESNAYNDVAGRWGKLVDSFTALLTMVAVALFLFGSAFVLYGRNRIIFVVLGGVLVATALAWGGWLAAARQPATPSDQAARDYAAGVVAMEQASTPSGYQPAINDFAAAIKLRRDYALAYVERASAEALRGSEEVGAGFVSVTDLSPYWARLAASDELEGYELGDHDASQLIDVGWGYYVLWTVNGGRAPAPAIAARFFARATELDPTNPLAWLDLGIADLAIGGYRQGWQAYQAGVTRMLYACTASGGETTCDKPQPTTSYALRQAWLAGAMESLEALAGTHEGASSPALRAEILKVEGLLTASLAKGALATRSAGPVPRVGDLEGFLDPNYLELDVPVPSGLSALEMARTPLTVLWYQRPVGSSRWSAISETACWGHGQQTCGRFDSATDSFQFITQLLLADNQCFTNVEYKAELWASGSLAASLFLSPKDDYIQTDLAPALAKSMNIGICVPSNWTLQPQHRVRLSVFGSKTSVTGLLASSEMEYSAPGGDQSAYLFRLYPERTSPAGTALSLPEVVAEGEREAISLLRGRGLPPDLEARESQSSGVWGASLSDMNVTGYVSPTTHTDALVGAAVMTLKPGEASAAQEDTAVSGLVTEDDAVTVVIVTGPARSDLWSGAHPLGLQIFSSFSLLNYG